MEKLEKPLNIIEDEGKQEEKKKVSFKFKPSIDADDEFSSDEEFIGAYLEGIRMLLGGNELKFDPNGSENSLAALYDGNCYQVSSMSVKDGEWDDTIIDITLQSEKGEQKVSITKEMIDAEDAWKLMTVVFEKTGYENYKDVHEFYGYELS